MARSAAYPLYRVMVEEAANVHVDTLPDGQHSNPLKTGPFHTSAVAVLAALMLSGCRPWMRSEAPVEQPSSQPAAIATLDVAEAFSSGGFALLPQKAQYIVSGDIGKDHPVYHARPDGEGGFLMEMPQQDLRAELSAAQGWRLFTGGFEWGLQLDGWGFGDTLTVLAAAPPTAEGNRVQFDRGPLTEWYRNGPWGLQQGFTLVAPPTLGSPDDPLTLVLHQYGDLQAEVEPGARGLKLLTPDGTAVLRYSGLLAWDADGRSLPAWMESDGERLRLRVQAGDAQYPLTIDPWANATQIAILTASDAASGDELGWSVSITDNGDTIAAGAYQDNPGSASKAGSVYVWVSRWAAGRTPRRSPN